MRKEASTKAFLRREGVRNNQADRSDEAQSQLLSLLLFYVFDWGDDMDERGRHGPLGRSFRSLVRACVECDIQAYIIHLIIYASQTLIYA